MSEIIINKFSFKRKILAFAISNFLMKEVDEKKIGRMKVRIQLKNAARQSLFDKQNILTAQKKEMKISIGAFQKIKKGTYDFLLDATDLLTGKTANLSQQVVVKR